MRNLAWCVVVAFVSIGPPVADAIAATTWYVDGSTCSGSGSGTELDPFCTIQEGLDLAVSGDTVLVSSGTYAGVGNRDLDFAGKAITLRSVGGWANCIIDAGGSVADPHRGFFFQTDETEASIVDGFTITGGYSTDGGGGVRCSYGSSPTLRNCVFVGNTTEDNGGAMWTNGHPTLVNCLLSGNEAGVHGGGIYLSYGSPALINCTLSGNRAVFGGGIYHEGPYSAIELTDCIVWGNVPSLHQFFVRGPGSGIVTYSCIAGGYVGTGNTDADPRFMSEGYWDAEDAWVDGDWRLQPGSPCIDAGDDGASLLPTDLSGNPRILDGDSDATPTVDMGAFEFVVTLCGNGAIDVPESCDDVGASAGCDADCTAVVCGDGIVNTMAGESCDDGNTVDGDGCDSDCILAICGDGTEGPGEECDDGNTADGDGCSSVCRFEGIPCTNSGECALYNDNACEWDRCGGITPGICDPPIQVIFGDVTGHGPGTPPNGIVNIFDVKCAVDFHGCNLSGPGGCEPCANADVAVASSSGCPHHNGLIKLTDLLWIMDAFGPVDGSGSYYACDCPANPY